MPLVLLLGYGGMRLRNGRTRDADCAGFNIGRPKRFRLFGGLISELIAVGAPTDSVDKLIFMAGSFRGLKLFGYVVSGRVDAEVLCDAVCVGCGVSDGGEPSLIAFRVSHVRAQPSKTCKGWSGGAQFSSTRAKPHSVDAREQG